MVAEMMALKARGADAALHFVTAAPDHPDEARYIDLVTLLEASFLNKLRSGDLVASGYDSRAALDEPITRIPPNYWRVLEPDFENSSAALGSREIIGIGVRPREQTAPGSAVAGLPVPTTSTTESPRLLIMKGDMEATLDGTPIQLTARSFALIIFLAEALIAGSGPQSRAEIERKLYSPNASEDAARDVVYELRKAIASALGNADARDAVVKTHRGKAYVLALQPHQVMIQP